MTHHSTGPPVATILDSRQAVVVENRRIAIEEHARVATGVAAH